MFLYSTVNIPYTALLGVISGDPVERADAATSKFIGAFSAGIIVSATALPLAKYFGEGNDAKGWHMTMIIYAAAAVVFLLVTFLSAARARAAHRQGKNRREQGLGRHRA